VGSITVPITEERLRELRQLAASLNVTAEELVRVGIEELLATGDEGFRRAMEYVMKKNAELYRRLA